MRRRHTWWRGLWRDILATFADWDRYLVQRFGWHSWRSAHRVVDRVVVIQQVFQLLFGALLVWLINRVPADATGVLVEHVFTAIWVIVALVNVWSLVRGGSGAWRRGRGHPN